MASTTVPRNIVDALLERVKQIQGSCAHKFRVLQEPKLKESLVKGIFIALDASSHSDTAEVAMKIHCEHCSKEEEVLVSERCPKCLGRMHNLRGLERREKYFGADYVYYAAKLKRCKGCGFTVVVDEWNQ